MSVTLRHRFEWVCPDCGRTGVADYKTVHVTEDVLRRLHHIDEWKPIPDDITADGWMVPDEVTCEGCGATHEAMPPVECDEVEEE